MTSSDDDWRSRVDDYWRSRNARDDRQWEVDRASERSSRLHDALRRGDHDTSRWITGVPPADAAYGDDDAPERSEPPTAGEQFREHKQALLFNLRWAENFLPPELLEDWTRRVERLDIEEAETDLPAIEAVRDEYERAAYRHEPSSTEVSRRMEWDYYVPRIGHEIEWLVALYRHVLSFG